MTAVPQDTIPMERSERHMALKSLALLHPEMLRFIAIIGNLIFNRGWSGHLLLIHNLITVNLGFEAVECRGGVCFRP